MANDRKMDGYRDCEKFQRRKNVVYYKDRVLFQNGYTAEARDLYNNGLL